MKFINLFSLFFVIIICSCNNNEPIPSLEKKVNLQYTDFSKNTGISIVNGPRQGSHYVDATNTDRIYTCITTTIRNDSIVPINLKIAFAREYDSLRSHHSLMSDVFLLPRELTPKKQQFDNGMSKELKHFLDTRKGKSDSLNILLNPKEQCVMNFGVLTALQYKDPFTFELKLAGTKDKSSPVLPLALIFDNPSAVIPCGQLSFPVK